MNSQIFVKDYAKIFGYKEFITGGCEHTKNKQLYVKQNNLGFIVIEKLIESKYVNFYFNDQHKIFKASDLMHAILDQTPVAWEEESHVGR